MRPFKIEVVLVVAGLLILGAVTLVRGYVFGPRDCDRAGYCKPQR